MLKKKCGEIFWSAARFETKYSRKLVYDEILVSDLKLNAENQAFNFQSETRIFGHHWMINSMSKFEYLPKSSNFDQTTVLKLQNRQISSKSQNLPLGQLIDPDGAHLPLVGIFTALDWHQLKKNSRNFQVKCYMRGKIWVYERFLSEIDSKTKNLTLPKFQILVSKFEYLQKFACLTPSEYRFKK